MKKTLIRFSLFFAWFVALLAVLGSLYYSQMLGFAPCNLCWYQRICLFPLIFILGIAAFHNDRKIGIYVYPQIILGALIAFFQGFYPICKKMGWLHLNEEFCGPTSCFNEESQLLGVPLALWSLCAFIAIGIFLRLSYSSKL